MKQRAIALPVVLSVLTLMLIIVSVVASSGVVNLQQARVDTFQKQSLYAAEAGIARSIRDIIGGGTGNLNGQLGQSSYQVRVTMGPSVGPPQVPAGAAYLLSTATTGNRYERRVGVMIRGLQNGEATSSFPYTVAAGGTVDIEGGGRVGGSLKSTGDLRVWGGVRITPVSGNGRVLSHEDIQLGNGVKVDSSQDIRAAQTVNQSGSNVFANDSTPASSAFINDGRFTNTLNLGEVGEVLPNPDPVTLLGLTEDGLGDYVVDPLTGLYQVDAARTDVVQHPETVVGNLALDGKIHFFPDGVTIDTVSGEGTIVSGRGNPVTFNRAIHGFARVNVLALRWQSQMPALGNPSITFTGGHNEIAGLILAHGNVSTQGNFNLRGQIVCYAGNFTSNGNRNILYEPSGMLLPGFESWLTGGFGGVGGGLGLNQPVMIISWQRF